LDLVGKQAQSAIGGLLDTVLCFPTQAIDLIVIAVKETLLLIAVHRIIGGVKVQDQLIRPAASISAKIEVFFTGSDTQLSHLRKNPGHICSKYPILYV